MSLGLLNAGNVSQYNTQVEQLIRQIIQSESKPISQLQERKTSLEKQQEIFDQASSTLANLQTKAEGISSLFDQRTSASSNPDILGVSAGAGAKPGIYEVSVERLAKAHTLASHRIPSQGTNLAQIFGPGQHHFFVTTQGRRVEVVLEIPEVMDETGQPPTNDDLLRLVAEAIQKANAAAGFGQHGFGGQVLRDTPTSTRLVLKSNCTGSSNQLFLEDPEGVLQVLGIQPESKATEMTGGWIYAPEGQAKLREETVNLFQPLVDMPQENVPAVSDALGTLADYAARLTNGEGAPLAQALANVVQLLNSSDDLAEDPDLELAFESIADLVDRLDDQAVEALSREFLRRAGELRGPESKQTETAKTGGPGIATGSSSPLSNAFDGLAVAVQMLGDGEDTETAFEDFRIALTQLTTEDRAELLDQFQTALDGINALRRKEGDALTNAFVSMVRPLFDLTVEERSSVLVQFLNIADVFDALGTPTATRAGDEFRELADLVESMSQPLSDPLETPYASIYDVFYVLPQETRDTLANEFSHFAAQLEHDGHGDVAKAIQSLADAVADPNIQNNFTVHFNDFATTVGSLSLDDRHEVSQALGTFCDQIRRRIPEEQARLLCANIEILYNSIGELNQFQRVAFEDQMISLTEALDGLTTDERARIREEMLKSVDHLRTLLPIDLPDEVNSAFAVFNGAANDLSQEDRTILSAELARVATDDKNGTPSQDVAHALDALSRTVFYAGEPGSFDSHQQEFLWSLGTLNEQERHEFVERVKEAANRLPGLIGEDATSIVPALRQMATLMGQSVVFEAPAAHFLSALDSAASATGTFDDGELEQINNYLPELANALAQNVNGRGQELIQSLAQAGQAFAQISPASQGILGQVLQYVANQIDGKLSGTSGEAFSNQVNSLVNVLNNLDSFEDLNAHMTLDGIPVIRDSNTISDLIDGVTFDIKNVTGSEATDSASRTIQVKVDNDTENIVKGIQDFVDAYNQVVDFVEKQTNIDKETYERAPLAGNSDYLRLRLNLRQAINNPIAQEDGPAFLRSIGLSIGTGVNDTNQLKMDDSNALCEALANNLDFVKSLFTAPDGAATRVADFVDEYLRPNGIISRDKTRIDQNQEHLDDRIDVLNTRMDARKQFLQNEYNSIAEQLLALSSQTQAIQGIGQ